MGKQILICDDAAFMRMMLKDILVKKMEEEFNKTKSLQITQQLNRLPQ